METVIALGIVALLLTSFLAVFGPAANNVQRAVNAEEAERLASGLEAEMNVLRASDTDYSTAFEKAFDWIAMDKLTGAELILIYKYRADASKTSNSDDADDSFIPPFDVSTLNEDEVIQDKIIVQSAVRLIADIQSGNGLDQLKAVDGPVFAVQLTQLVYDSDGALVEAPDEVSFNAGEIYDPRTHDAFTTPNGSPIYPEAVIAFNAKFYLLPTNTTDFINGRLQGLTDTSLGEGELSDALGKPVFTRNIAVRR